MRHYKDKLPAHEQIIVDGFDRKTKQEVRQEVRDKIVQMGAKIHAEKLAQQKIVQPTGPAPMPIAETEEY